MLAFIKYLVFFAFAAAGSPEDWAPLTSRAIQRLTFAQRVSSGSVLAYRVNGIAQYDDGIDVTVTVNNFERRPVVAGDMELLMPVLGLRFRDARGDDWHRVWEGPFPHFPLWRDQKKLPIGERASKRFGFCLPDDYQLQSSAQQPLPEKHYSIGSARAFSLGEKYYHFIARDGEPYAVRMVVITYGSFDIRKVPGKRPLPPGIRELPAVK